MTSDTNRDSSSGVVFVTVSFVCRFSDGKVVHGTVPPTALGTERRLRSERGPSKPTDPTYGSSPNGRVYV